MSGGCYLKISISCLSTSVDDCVVLNLIAQLQKDDVAVVLFEMDNTSMRMEYVNSYQNWYQVNRLKKCKIPSREQFMAQTF
jgi:hypothetical protein